MNTQEIIEAVGKVEPELMTKTAQVIALTEKLYPDFVDGIAQDFNTICSVVIEKTAASPSYANFGLGVAGTVTGGLLGSIATDLYDAAKRGLSKGSNFRRIMEANPSLKREVDAKSLRMAYDSLHRFAPDFTADPLVGGALLKQIADLPASTPKTIVELIGARKNLHDSKGKVFTEGLARQGEKLVPDSNKFEEGKKLEDYKQTLRNKNQVSK